MDEEAAAPLYIWLTHLGYTLSVSAAQQMLIRQGTLEGSVDGSTLLVNPGVVNG